MTSHRATTLLDRVPDQSGRTVLITGGTRGLGRELVRSFAAKGARVLLAGRDEQAGADVVRELGSADVAFIRLDLQDTGSIENASARVSEEARLDVLVNNAGVMAPPLRFAPTGYESQWATNVIGPFDLTTRLLPLLLSTPASRIVAVSSLAHTIPLFSMDRVRLEVQGSGYRPFVVYGHTKLAEILVSRELDRRLGVAGSSTSALAAHPGVAGTDIAGSAFSWAPDAVQDAAVRVWTAVTRDPRAAAGPILAAATAPGARGGDLIGPRAVGQTLGPPARVPSSPRAHDGELGRELVRWLEAVTGRTFSPSGPTVTPA